MSPNRHFVILVSCLLVWLMLVTQVLAFDVAAIGECILSGKATYIGSCLIEGFGPDGVEACKTTSEWPLTPWAASDCDNAYATVQGAAQDVQAGIDTAEEAWTCMTTDPIACANEFLTNTGITDPNLTKVAMLTGQVHFDMGIDLLPEALKDAGVTAIMLTREPFVLDGSDLCRTFVTGWYAGTVTVRSLAVSGPDGRWLAVVPACGKTTYTFKPTNVAFDWSPGERTVTVGGDVTQNLLPVSQDQPAAEATTAASLQVATPAEQPAAAAEATESTTGDTVIKVDKTTLPQTEVTNDENTTKSLPTKILKK